MQYKYLNWLFIAGVILYAASMFMPMHYTAINTTDGCSGSANPVHLMLSHYARSFYKYPWRWDRPENFLRFCFIISALLVAISPLFWYLKNRASVKMGYKVSLAASSLGVWIWLFSQWRGIGYGYILLACSLALITFLFFIKDKNYKISNNMEKEK